jgi:L-fuculose-phosphate aldolase
VNILATPDIRVNEMHFALWSSAYQILDMEGHSDMAQGHFSIRDPDGRGFWMKRVGISLGEVKGADDFVLVDLDGRKLIGGGGVHGEWPIHSEIFRCRPDVNAIGHTHPFYATVFSSATEPLTAVTHEGAVFRGPVPRFTGTSNLVDTPELGRDVAKSLGSHAAVFLRNHGIVFCSKAVEECVLTGIFLEKACKAQLLISASGLRWEPTDPSELETKYLTVMTSSYIRNSWEFFCRKLSRQGS